MFHIDFENHFADEYCTTELMILEQCIFLIQMLVFASVWQARRLICRFHTQLSRNKIYKDTCCSFEETRIYNHHINLYYSIVNTDHSNLHSKKNKFECIFVMKWWLVLIIAGTSGVFCFPSYHPLTMNRRRPCHNRGVFKWCYRCLDVKCQEYWILSSIAFPETIKAVKLFQSPLVAQSCVYWKTFPTSAPPISFGPEPTVSAFSVQVCLNMIVNLFSILIREREDFLNNS